MAKSINIKSFTKFDLEKLLTDDKFWQKEIIPISKNRILSQINNPRCNSEDILFSIMTNDGNLEGFIGFLPDTIEHKWKIIRFFWISTWWSNPENTFR